MLKYSEWRSSTKVVMKQLCHLFQVIFYILSEILIWPFIGVKILPRKQKSFSHFEELFQVIGSMLHFAKVYCVGHREHYVSGVESITFQLKSLRVLCREECYMSHGLISLAHLSAAVRPCVSLCHLEYHGVCVRVYVSLHHRSISASVSLSANMWHDLLLTGFAFWFTWGNVFVFFYFAFAVVDYCPILTLTLLLLPSEWERERERAIF